MRARASASLARTHSRTPLNFFSTRCTALIALAGVLAMALLLTLLAGPAAASQRLSAAQPSFELTGPVSIFLERGPSIGIERVATERSEAFLPLGADSSFALKEGETLWLRFSVFSSEEAQAPWTLNVPLPYIDYVALHQQRPDGAWSTQVSGDTVATAQWSHPGMYPEFTLQSRAGVDEVVLLEVRNFKPTTVPLRIATAAVRANAREMEYLAIGVLVGTLLMWIGASAVVYASSKESAHLSYTGFTALIALVVISSTGLCGQLLWPISPGWANYSHMALPVLGVGSSLAFIRHLAFIGTHHPALDRLLRIATWTALPLIALPATLDRSVAEDVHGAYLGLGTLLALLTAVLAWRRDKPVGTWLLLAYVPQGAVLLIMTAQMLQWMPTFWQSRYILMLAVAASVAPLLHAVQVRARDRRDARDRVDALPVQDALTGLLVKSVYLEKLHTTLERARLDREPAAIVVVEVVNHRVLRDTFGDATAEQCLLRAVVKLYRVLRDVDPAGRLDTARFGLILEGVTNRETLNERMVKLIASGLIPLPELKPEVTLQFHVAAVLLSEHIPDAKTLLNELFDVLANMGPRTRRPIRFLEPAMTIPAPLSESTDTYAS